MYSLKETRVRWIGSIPKDWKLEKVKYHFYLSREKAQQDNPVILTLARSGVKIRDISNNEGQMAESYYNYNPVKPGDLLLNTMDLYSGDNCNISHVTGVISPAYANLRSRGVANPDYYNYYFKVQYLIMALFAHGKGVSKDNRWTLNNETLLNYYIPVPSREEQDQIVRYLDWKCSQINKLIHGYQREIDLLDERKRSFAYYAVTQGLNPKAEKTASSLYWLNSIPKAWKINSLANILSEVKCVNRGMQENNLLSLSYGEIKRRSINATDGLLPANFEGYNVIEKDDIVLRLTDLQNDHKSLRTGIATERGIITSAYLTIRNKSDNNSEFIQLFLHAFDLAKGFYNIGASGVRQSLNWETIKTLKVLIPPIPGQKQIVEAIKYEYVKAKEAIDSIIKEITLLKEYRTRLISDVVTGQIDVRGIDIPDYTPEEDIADSDEIPEEEASSDAE